MKSATEVAREVVLDEVAALQQVAAGLDEAFARVIELLLIPGTQVFVSGIGKSGNIAKKIAASLASTGTPASFMHPVEALHGDLGNVSERHVLLALSRSGNTEELIRFATHFRRLGGPVVALTQGRESKLAELSRFTLLLPDLPEAGPYGLAPTTSCMMQLALGDALTMALFHARGFSPEDFARYHPEGTLGRRLLLRAEDLMVPREKLPLVDSDAGMQQLLLEMSGKSLGLAILVARDGRLAGMFTDGDLRRLCERVEKWHDLKAHDAHARSRRAPGTPPVPISTIRPGRPAVDCLQIMREAQISSLIVADDQDRPVGVLRLFDLIAAGL